MKQGRELLVGTVIVVGILVAVVGTLWLQGTNWGRPVTGVEVWVRDVGQLTQGNPVVYRGVPIGRVGTITVDPTGGFVRVGAELEGEVAMPEDARALISPQSMFGDWQLEIVTLSRYPRIDYYELPSPVHFEEGVRVIGGWAIPDISRLAMAADEISENLATLTDRIDRTFTEETAEAIVELVHNMRELSDDVGDMVRQQAETFETVVAQVELAVTEIGEAATVGRRTMERVDAMLARGDIDSILVNVRTASRSIDELVVGVGESRQELTLVLARADTTLQSLDRVMRTVEAGEGTVGRLLHDPSFALRAESAVFQLERLIEEIRENPGRFVRLSIF